MRGGVRGGGGVSGKGGVVGSGMENIGGASVMTTVSSTGATPSSTSGCGGAVVAGWRVGGDVFGEEDSVIGVTGVGGSCDASKGRGGPSGTAAIRR